MNKLEKLHEKIGVSKSDIKCSLSLRRNPIELIFLSELNTMILSTNMYYP